VKAEDAQDEHHDHDETHKVNNAVHGWSPRAAQSNGGLCEFELTVDDRTSRQLRRSTKTANISLLVKTSTATIRGRAQSNFPGIRVKTKANRIA
jgi:hypothetical protein